MSELKTRYITDTYLDYFESGKHDLAQIYLKSEADKVIAEKDAEIAEPKSRIAPKKSDKPLQERLNEVCKKHGVSTLQDLDWAFCEAEKRNTKFSIEASKEINHQKYKRCLAMAKWCENAILGWMGFKASYSSHQRYVKVMLFIKWRNRWIKIAEQFKDVK